MWIGEPGSSRASSQSCSHDEQCCSRGLGSRSKGPVEEEQAGKADTCDENRSQEEGGTEAEVLVFSERTPYFVWKP